MGGHRLIEALGLDADKAADFFGVDRRIIEQWLSGEPSDIEQLAILAFQKLSATQVKEVIGEFESIRSSAKRRANQGSFAQSIPTAIERIRDLTEDEESTNQRIMELWELGYNRARISFGS